MATTRLLAPDITQGQSQKHVTANAAHEVLDEGIAGFIDIDAAGTGTLTLADAQALPNHLDFTGILTGNRTVEVPAREKGWLVRNSTTGAFTLSMKVAGGSNTIEIPRTGMIPVWTDGSEIYSAHAAKLVTILTDASAAGTVTFDFSDASHLRATLTENISSMTISGGYDGQRLILEATQDGTGGWTMSWPANVRFGTTLPSGSFTPDATANLKTYFGFIYNAVDDKYDAVSITKGF
jgi:hypothetical protein